PVPAAADGSHSGDWPGHGVRLGDQQFAGPTLQHGAQDIQIAELGGWLGDPTTIQTSSPALITSPRPASLARGSLACADAPMSSGQPQIPPHLISPPFTPRGGAFLPGDPGILDMGPVDVHIIHCCRYPGMPECFLDSDQVSGTV
ncbi:MAG TPA: hypothetical protein VFO16_09190, partial [Pseudonocardiaceae bacterium]|nr:hypothetical protein [Pseudonocardiaceae bacterium]